MNSRNSDVSCCLSLAYVADLQDARCTGVRALT